MGKLTRVQSETRAVFEEIRYAWPCPTHKYSKLLKTRHCVSAILAVMDTWMIGKIKSKWKHAPIFPMEMRLPQDKFLYRGMWMVGYKYRYRLSYQTGNHWSRTCVRSGIVYRCTIKVHGLTYQSLSSSWTLYWCHRVNMWELNTC